MADARRQDRGRRAGKSGVNRRGRPMRGLQRSSWCCATAFLLLLRVDAVATAQTLSSAHELSFTGGERDENCAVAPTIGTSARLAGPFGSLAADAAAGVGPEDAPLARGAASMDLRSPEWHGWSLQSHATWSSRETVSCGLRSPERAMGLEASYRLGAGGVWLGYRWRASDPLLHPATSDGLSVGAWREIGALVMSVSLGTQPDTGTRTSLSAREVVRVDSFFNDTLQRWETFQYNSTVVDTTVNRWRSPALESRARLGWSGGRWSADGTVGVLWGRNGASTTAWGTLATSLALTRRLAVVGGFVAAPQRGLYLAPGRRVVTLGFRVSPAPAGHASSPPVRLPPRGFEAREGVGDELVLAVRAPNAGYVEIAGDFTTWQARAMRPAAGGWWELAVKLRPGRYQVNVRIDGARWMPPPGLPSVRDEFGGTVGVLVVR